MKNQEKKQFKVNNETGNVLVIVLITIALLASLTFAFIKGDSGSNTNTLSKGEAKIVASRILKYAKSVENTVRQLQLVNGCSHDQISFENSTESGYVNASSIPECLVFGSEGGGLVYQSFEEFVPYSSLTAFSSGNNISGTGTEDIVFHMIDIDQNLCEELNRSVGGPTQGDGSVYTETGSQRNIKYTGLYGSGWTYTLSGFSGTLPKKFCIIQRCYVASPCPNEDMYSFTYQIHER